MHSSEYRRPQKIREARRSLDGFWTHSFSRADVNGLRYLDRTPEIDLDSLSKATRGRG
jgi:hypothetical protein